MKIHYVSGSRADFGLMKQSLMVLSEADSKHKLEVVVTGQHMLAQYGNTIDDIRCAGISIGAEIPVTLSGGGGYEMGAALSEELTGMLNYWQSNRPDLVLLLGDRGEMLAAALAAVHLGIHVAHIHGGERSGTLDESFRHAISKLSHLHFTATEESAGRLAKMGEDPEFISVIGAPGLVGITDVAKVDREVLQKTYGLEEGLPLALTIFHPVVQEAEQAAQQISCLVDAIDSSGFSQIVLSPNSDAGANTIEKRLDSFKDSPRICVLTHLKRDHYLEILASSDMIIGNSSSGIIESASLGTVCLNVGDRQNFRQRNTNTIDCPKIKSSDLKSAIAQAQLMRPDYSNVYGDGQTHFRLRSLMDDLILNRGILKKVNKY